MQQVYAQRVVKAVPHVPPQRFAHHAHQNTTFSVKSANPAASPSKAA